MAVNRTSHAVYDTKYHLVWAPKYRKWIPRGDIRDRIKEIFKEISRNHDFEIETMQAAGAHIHIVLSFPPKYSISKVVAMLRILSANVISKGSQEVIEGLWGEEFWEGGYFVPTVGDQVTADVIRDYVTCHCDQEKSPKQLKLP